MKTHLIKFTTQPIKNLRGILAAFIPALIFFNLLPKVWSQTPPPIDLFWTGNAASPAVAGSGTWFSGSSSGFPNSWSTSGTTHTHDTWTDGSVAHFQGSVGGTATLDGNITAAGINFDFGANAFTINTNLATLTVQGAGIMNNSKQTQTIANSGGGFDVGRGLTVFSNTSTAGSVVIINNGFVAADGQIGETQFLATSTAGGATIINNGGGAAGKTQFLNTSTAGNATIINNGGTGGDSGGETDFLANSDGGTARAITSGNGSLDISGLTTAGMGIGSIEGSGNYFLGSKTLTVGGNNLSSTVSGVIQDGGLNGGTGGSLTKVDTGTLTLTGANTYSGGTNLNGGILAVNADANLGSGALSFGGGTLEALTAGAGINSAKGVTLNAGGGTFLADLGTVSTLSGPISGPGSLSKAGVGTLTLSGLNTYSGNTNVSLGTLRAGSSTGFSPNSAFTLASVLDLNGFNNTVGSLGGNGTVTNNGPTLAALTVGVDNTNTTFSGTLSNGISALRLIKAGTGTLTLTGANTYSGGTNANGGTLAVSGDANLGTGPLSFNGGTLEALPAGGGITSAKTVTLNAGGGTFLADADTISTLSGQMSGPGSLIKAGAGTLTMLGVNAYIGGTNLNGGTLAVNGDANLGIGPLSFNGGSLEALAAGAGITSAKAVTLNAVGGTFLADAGTISTLGGVITGAGSLTKAGLGNLTLSGANTYSGGTSLNSGILAVNNDANLGTGPLSFNGGTLEALAAGGGLVSSKAFALSTGGGTFLADANTTSTLSGVITGAGSLTKAGLGNLTLSGVNSYSGGTNLKGGILAVNNDANLGTGPLSFNGGTLEASAIGGGIVSSKAIALNAVGGTFLADASTTSTLSGVIAGAGSLTKAGLGALVLIGANTYGGGTTISAGTLQFGNGGSSGSITGNVADNGILVFDRSDAPTFAGIISGLGSVAQIGTGTTILTGNSTYIGGTTISAGTLRLGNGGSSGSIIGNVNDNGTLAFDRGDTVTFGGVVSGIGNVVKLGTGTLTISGINTYTGTTTVNAGSLIVDGSIASAQTLVSAAGLIGGRGSFGGSLVNSGIVSPGDPSGTLTVIGNYIQNAAGTLRIQVAGLAPSQHDLLSVNGHADLAGTLQLIRVGGFQLHVGDQLTFLTANGGVSGTFGSVQSDFPTLVKAQIVYQPTAVLLQGAQGSFVDVACTPNSAAVGRALDSAVGDPRSTGLINFLNDQPTNQLCRDMQLIAPEQVASIFNVGVSLANVQVANLQRRLDDIRAGSTGFSAAGFTINGDTPSSSIGLAGVTGPEGKSAPSVMAPIPENRWGVWITGVGEFTSISSTGNAAGYDLRTGGFSLGVDYRISSNFAVGLTAGYAYTSVDLANNGNLDVNSGKLGLYATAFGNGFYLDSSVTGGPSGYDIHRSALLGTASGNTDGGDFNVLISGGYDWKKGGLSVGPTASFQYTYVSFNDFTESGSLAPLKFSSQNAESERTAFGMKASYDWKVGGIPVKPEISLAWQHEYGDQAYSIVSNFANGAGRSFSVNGPQVGRDSLLIGAGAAILLSERVSIYAYYDGELGRTNYQSNNVSAGFRVTF